MTKEALINNEIIEDSKIQADFSISNKNKEIIKTETLSFKENLKTINGIFANDYLFLILTIFVFLKMKKSKRFNKVKLNKSGLKLYSLIVFLLIILLSYPIQFEKTTFYLSYTVIVLMFFTEFKLIFIEEISKFLIYKKGMLAVEAGEAKIKKAYVFILKMIKKK